MEKLDLVLKEISNLKEFVSRGFEDVQKEIAEVKKEITEISKKLDTVIEQTAQNAEYQYHLKQLESRVASLETDMKIVKKVITNQ